MEPTRAECLEVLGVQEGVSLEGIRKAFRHRAMELHPDRSRGRETEFIQLVEAYRLLVKSAPKPYAPAKPSSSVPDERMELWTPLDAIKPRPEKRRDEPVERAKSQAAQSRRRRPLATPVDSPLWNAIDILSIMTVPAMLLLLAVWGVLW